MSATERPGPVDVLGECDPPPRRLKNGRMKYMIHQAVVDGRLPTVMRRRWRSTGWRDSLVVSGVAA